MPTVKNSQFKQIFNALLDAARQTLHGMRATNPNLPSQKIDCIIEFPHENRKLATFWVFVADRGEDKPVSVVLTQEEKGVTYTGGCADCVALLSQYAGREGEARWELRFSEYEDLAPVV